MKKKFIFFCIFLLVVTIVSAFDYKWNTEASFNNGSYYNTTFDANFPAVVLNNGTYEMPDDNAYNSTTGINMTGNVLLMHMNDGTYELPNSALDDSSGDTGINMTGNVLLMHMNDAWTDTSGEGNNGVATNAVFTTNSKLGSHAGSFDGSGDYVNLSNPTSLQMTNYLTVSVWIKKTNTGTIQRIISKDDGSTNRDWLLQVQPDGTLFFGVFKSNTIYYAPFSSTNISDTQWHHVVINNNGTGLNLYIDGVLESFDSTAGGTMDNDPTNVVLGSISGGTNYYFNGSIDEVAIWNRSLSADEILNIYNKQAPLVRDTSGQQNNGTGQGAVNCSATGKLSQGCNFDGDYVSVSDSSELNITHGDFTAMAWIYYTSNTTDIPILTRRVNDANHDGFRLYIHSTGYAFHVIDGTSGYVGSINGSYITKNTWHYVSMTASGDDNNRTIKYYLDGSEDYTSSGNNVGVIESPVSTYIGRDRSGATYFNGSIDEVAIWNRSLSATEISNLYYQQYGKYYPNGTYESEVYNATQTSNWTTISWTEGVPYGEELPDNNENEALTTLGGINMTGNVLLLHLNDGGPFEFPDSRATANDMNMTGNVLLVHMDNDWNDYSGNSNDGTAFGATFTSSSKLGSYGGNFDGVNDRVDLGTEFISTGDITSCAWIYPIGNSSGGAGRIIDNGKYIFLRGDIDSKIYFYSNGATLVLSDSTAALNTWSHVCVSRNSTGNATIYINGAVGGPLNGNSGTPSSGTTNVIIGNRAAGDRAWNGTIDEVAIWNRSLSAEEIKHIYEVQAPLVRDTSGQSNNGTGQGAVNCSATGKLGTYGCSFDGSGDYVNVTITNSLKFDNTTSVSYGAWVKRSGNVTGQILGSSSDPGRYWMYASSVGRLSCNINYGVGYDYWLNSQTIYGDSQWHYLVCVVDKNALQFRLYVDGNLNSNSSIVAKSNNNTVPLTIGYSHGSGNPYFNGSIDEVAIWNRSLSATEILNIYKRGALRLNLSARSCNDSLCDGESWVDINDDNSSGEYVGDLQTNQYFQYKFDFESDSNNTYTPELYNVSLIYVTAGDVILPTITLNYPNNETYTSDNSPDFNFNVTDDTATTLDCILYINNTMYGTNSTVINNTATIITANDTLTDGTYEWDINCSDSVNINTSETRTLYIDTVTPTVTIVNPTATTYFTKTLDLNATATESIDTWWYILNGGANTTFVQDVVINAIEGSNTLYVYGNDSTGQTGSDSVSFDVDSEQPVVSLITPTNETILTVNQTSFIFNVTDSVSTTFNCVLYINSTNYGSNASVDNNTNTGITNNPPLNDGSYEWWVNCTDTNYQIMSEVRELTINKESIRFPSWGVTDKGGNVDIFNVSTSDNSTRAFGNIYEQTDDRVCTVENGLCNSSVADLWVNITGDTMTGGLIIETNLTVYNDTNLSSGALYVKSNVSQVVIGNPSVYGNPYSWNQPLTVIGNMELSGGSLYFGGNLIVEGERLDLMFGVNNTEVFFQNGSGGYSAIFENGIGASTFTTMTPKHNKTGKEKWIELENASTMINNETKKIKKDTLLEGEEANVTINNVTTEGHNVDAMADNNRLMIAHMKECMVEADKSFSKYYDCVMGLI